MNIWDIVSTVSISAAVSGLVSMALKTWIKSAIERRYHVEIEEIKKMHQLEIETLKAQLSVATTTQSMMTERRLTAYPTIVELVYRTRNMCRDISSHIPKATTAIGNELTARTTELENALYTYRLYLEQDKLFTSVHQYKNLVKTFCMKLSDMRYFLDHDESDRASHVQSELTDIFSRIEAKNGPVIDGLSNEIKP